MIQYTCGYKHWVTVLLQLCDLWNKSSRGVGLSHLVYLTITYQLVKLFGAALKKAAEVESGAHPP